jgi:SAM-dependent methyltransferase
MNIDAGIRLDNMYSIIRNIYKQEGLSSIDMRMMVSRNLSPTTLERNTHAEISTPIALVDSMISIIPKEFWKSQQKVLDPCCGKGNFVLGIFDAFYEGMMDTIPDPIERCRIIVKDCLHISDINPENVDVSSYLINKHAFYRCGAVFPCSSMNTWIGDALTLDVHSVWGLNITDITIIGNPPYSSNASLRNSVPLYNLFIDKYISGRYLLFIVPSRWFSGGKGLVNFRKRMLNRRDIVSITHEDDASKWFGKESSVVIKGGVNYFLKDINYYDDCLFNGIPYRLDKYDCLIKPEHHAIIDSIVNLNLPSVNTIYKGRTFGIETNDIRLDIEGYIRCFVSTKKSKTRVMYLEKFKLTDENTYWKVITVEAFDKEFSGFGDIFIGKPDEVHSGSYISFRVNSEFEALSLQSYLRTPFANNLLSIRKISQHIHKDTLLWIPLIPLDRIWNNESVLSFLHHNYSSSSAISSSNIS